MQITLKVENLCVKLTEPPRQVLNSICAHVKPGQILGKFLPFACQFGASASASARACSVLLAHVSQLLHHLSTMRMPRTGGNVGGCDSSSNEQGRTKANRPSGGGKRKEVSRKIDEQQQLAAGEGK